MPWLSRRRPPQLLAVARSFGSFTDPTRDPKKPLPRPLKPKPVYLKDVLSADSGRIKIMRDFAASYKEAIKDGVRTTKDEVMLAGRVVWRSFILGHRYSRRDLELLRRTAKDVFRLLPFASFIMTTGFTMTYLVWARLFPSILPSHFRKAADLIDKRQQTKQEENANERLAAAQELRHLTRQFVLEQEDNPDHRERLLRLMEDLQDPHAVLTARDIVTCAAPLQESLSLDNIDRSILVRMARFFGVEEKLPSPVLRFQLRRVIRSIQNDDKNISVEGVESLSQEELELACHTRGLARAGRGVDSPDVLRRRLSNWMSLSLSPNVPVTILVLYSAFKMQHATLEEVELGPIEVRLRCLEEERDDLLTVKASLEEKLERIRCDIEELERKAKDHSPRPEDNPTRPRIVWATELFTESELGHIRKVLASLWCLHASLQLLETC
eukprot:c18511_g1_i2.p1 GENE.c18511_g1_i2~~c18511_g1_i2.p1  ORF type:complete len:451 (+),score=103.37 c18511_g1_i2:36-1355(+)